MREFGSTAELIANYRRVHSVFFPPRPRLTTKNEKPPPVEPTPCAPPPPDALDVPQIAPLQHWQGIVRVVCVQYCIKRSELLGHRRLGNLVHARHVVCTLLRELLKMSTTAIGRRLGDRDHTTVLHGIRKITAQRIRDPDFCHDYAMIEMEAQQCLTTSGTDEQSSDLVSIAASR